MAKYGQEAADEVGAALHDMKAGKEGAAHATHGRS